MWNKHLTEYRLLHVNINPTNILLHLASCSIQLGEFSAVINLPPTTTTKNNNGAIDDPLADNQDCQKDFFSPEQIIWRYLIPNAENSWVVGALMHYMSMGEVRAVS